MRILAIETSCDETAAALVETTRDGWVRVVRSSLATSEKMHVKTGGIVPEVAAREQIQSILSVIQESLRVDTIAQKAVDAIAATIGPGLIGSLLVGVETAKTLAWAWQKPLIPVNHLVAHLYANFVNQTPQFPAVGLVVSGGHTDVVLMHNHRRWQHLGGTQDDAAGECFDKCAKLLGLGYPGGPAVAAEAAKFQIPNSKFQITLPRPMVKEKNYNFSFSGLKTAVAREVSKVSNVSKASTAIAYELQEAVVDVLVTKIMRAVKKYQPKSLLLGGGVAANQRLRHELEFRVKSAELNVKLFVPPPELCTDNAVMIGAAACYRFTPIPWGTITVGPSLPIL